MLSVQTAGFFKAGKRRWSSVLIPTCAHFPRGLMLPGGPWSTQQSENSFCLISSNQSYILSSNVVEKWRLLLCSWFIREIAHGFCYILPFACTSRQCFLKGIPRSKKQAFRHSVKLHGRLVDRNTCYHSGAYRWSCWVPSQLSLLLISASSDKTGRLRELRNLLMCCL